DDGGPMFTDDERRTLYDALEQSLGANPAAILMGHLPPVGWTDLATKGDIAELRGEMALLRADLRGEIAELRAEVHSLVPKFLAANLASMIGIAGLVLAAGALLR